MKHIFYFLLPVLLLTVSCKSSKEKMIARKWQAIQLENPEMDKLIDDQKHFLDTFGRNADVSANKTNYGVTNVDSVRESLQKMMDDYLRMQEHAVKNTQFDFRKDRIAIMNFSGVLDSANWYFDEEEQLILDEMKLKGTGSKLVMQVVSLQDTLLKLRFTEENTTSTVTFRPVEK